MNTQSHAANPNKVSTRIDNSWSTPSVFPENKKLLIVWRFLNSESDNTLKIDSFINGALIVNPVTITGTVNSLTMILFEDSNVDDPDF